MALNSGERQVAPTLQGIRRDHRARYEYAAALLPPRSRVVDLACGIGYGARILADGGHLVEAIDGDAESIDYARHYYAAPEISFGHGDLRYPEAVLAGSYDAAVCFETIEHLADPAPLLRALRARTGLLICSVPNQAVFPFTGQAFHHRHYTRAEFAHLLAETGWDVHAWAGQAGPESGVEPDLEGRTLIAVAVHRAEVSMPVSPPKRQDPVPVPEHVAIVALGPTCERYVDLVKRLGGRHKLADQTWVINALGDVLAHDLVFHMDDVRIQEVRAAAHPDSNIAAMLAWLKTHPGPVMTSRAHPDYPGLVEFPLQDVINALQCDPYFNGTGAYAIAYAIFLGVKKISAFGFDFTYPNAHHAEKGRACVEYLLGIAWARGIDLSLPDTTPLMDRNEPLAQRLYGYDTLDVTIEGDGNGLAKVTMVPHDRLPTAAAVEARYDHTKHPNPLVATSVKAGAA